MEYIESVIIGGGQAGLATSYFLNEERKEHLILDKSPKAAEVWRNERWDSFTLATPNWTVRMPGVEIDNSKREEFMPRNEIVEFFENYVDKFRLPVKYNSQVNSVEQVNDGYIVKTDTDTYITKNVVAATGFFQKPRIPDFALSITKDIHQIHSTRYRNPDLLPEGAVLVVGTGQSGCQIAEELYLAGRRVFLSTGGAGRATRRYRGKDVVEWLDTLHFFDLRPEQLPPGAGRFDPVPHVSGTKGGHSLNLHQFVRDGVRLFGKLRSTEAEKVFFAPNLYTNLQKADQFDLNIRNMVDRFIYNNHLDIPQDDITDMTDGYYQPVIESCTLVLLYSCTLVLLNSCTLVLLNSCTLELLYSCTLVLLYSCTLVLLYSCTLVLLYSYTLVLLLPPALFCGLKGIIHAPARLLSRGK
jgi:putative flavoprotein involved in K+ transport